MLNQYLANFRSDLSEKEKIGILQFNFGNTAISVKILVFYLLKDRIKILFEGFLERFREFSCIDLEWASVKRALKFCSVLLTLAYLSMIFAIVEAVLAHVKEGIPIQAEITIFPRSNDTSSIFYNVMRFLIELHWYYAVAVLVMIDSICILSLVFLGCKFKRLQMYFEELKASFSDNLEMKPRSVLEKEFKKGFVDGIKLHKDTLWCARNVQHALGNLYSIQIVESMVLIVITLVKMVATKHDITLLVSNLCYFIGIVTFTGAYMMAGGDVTLEAALLPTSIFHSGWELSRPRRGLRTLAVVALINSQVPVLMTAFGIISLSYTNFLMVLRHSYSFFAVMY